MIGDTLRHVRWVLVVVGCALVVSCGSPTPTVVPTALPTLNASLWMDFPTLRAGQPQAANLAITDPSGQPVAGITAVLVITADNYQPQQYHFPVTGNDGLTRVGVTLPVVTSKTTFTVKVVAVDSKGGSDEAVAAFDLYP